LRLKNLDTGLEVTPEATDPFVSVFDAYAHTLVFYTEDPTLG